MELSRSLMYDVIDLANQKGIDKLEVLLGDELEACVAQRLEDDSRL